MGGARAGEYISKPWWSSGKIYVTGIVSSSLNRSIPYYVYFAGRISEAATWVGGGGGDI